ncbi:MAG: glycoside hydrolase family 2 TIM barrel-domain containing protein [Acidobacteriota bacterium]
MEKQTSPVASTEWTINSGWLTRKVSDVGADGKTITAGGYVPQDWLEAIVPGTILTTLVHNGVYQDPYISQSDSADQILKPAAPDIYDEGRDFYTYWFYTTFDLPIATEGQRAWLQLRGINYSADVFLNGAQVNISLLKGMFLRHYLDITNLANCGGANRLAVIVYPVDHPGDVSPGGQGGDHQIAQDVTAQFVEGWDWIIPIPDRNTGIWDQVSVSMSGPVVIRDPHIITQLPNGPTNEALITVSADLFNGSDAVQSGTLTCRLGEQTQSQDFSLDSGDTQTLTLPALTIENPRLWWPNGYGSQELYDVDFSVDVPGYGSSDTESVRFGIREITSDIDLSTGGRVFSVNGQHIFIRGGNWICSDAMLQLSAKRYRDEVRFHGEMNLNMIRVWGGSIAERPEFYDACDEFGLLVMQEFWMTWDCNAGNPTWPINHELYINCAADTVKMLRNHPSLCFWCGGNELSYPQQPPKDIEAALTQDIMPNLDGMPGMSGTQRLYIPSSLSDGLGQHDGPYGIVTTSDYYTTTLNLYAFNPEMGSVGTPVVETLQRFLSADALATFPVYPTWGAEWHLHTYIPYWNPPCPDQMALYGAPQSVADFALRAQIVNYVQYRALYEGAGKYMWTHYTGILVWKSQNPWTGLRGQFYDYYLDQTGGYHGARKACEPLHIQLNWDDLTYGIVNCTSNTLANLEVQYTMYDYLNGQQLSQQSETVAQVDANSTYLSSAPITLLSDTLPIHFIRMVLSDSGGNPLSENLYWRSAAEPEDFTAFMDLPQVSLDGTVSISKYGSDYVLQANLTNSETSVAFFVRLKVLNPDVLSGAENRVLPTIYDDNYFTLMPGETRALSMYCSQIDAGYIEPQVWVEGYNVIASQLTPSGPA